MNPGEQLGLWPPDLFDVGLGTVDLAFRRFDLLGDNRQLRGVIHVSSSEFGADGLGILQGRVGQEEVVVCILVHLLRLRIAIFLDHMQ